VVEGRKNKIAYLFAGQNHVNHIENMHVELEYSVTKRAAHAEAALGREREQLVEQEGLAGPDLPAHASTTKGRVRVSRKATAASSTRYTPSETVTNGWTPIVRRRGDAAPPPGRRAVTLMHRDVETRGTAQISMTGFYMRCAASAMSRSSASSTTSLAPLPGTRVVHFVVALCPKAFTSSSSFVIVEKNRETTNNAKTFTISTVAVETKGLSRTVETSNALVQERVRRFGCLNTRLLGDVGTDEQRAGLRRLTDRSS
jgi:hypothetical protein